LFDWNRVNKSDGKFDEKKFADVAFEHLKRTELTSLEEYVEWVQPFLLARGVQSAPESRLRAAIPGIRERARTLSDAAVDLDFYFRAEPELDDKASKKFLTPESGPKLLSLAEALRRVESWSANELEIAVKHFAESAGFELKDFAQAARVALTGRGASPPLFEVMAVLGRDVTLTRLTRGAELASR
jgi:glutamyl-tRNA synthetase